MLEVYGFEYQSCDGSTTIAAGTVSRGSIALVWISLDVTNDAQEHIRSKTCKKIDLPRKLDGNGETMLKLSV